MGVSSMFGTGITSVLDLDRFPVVARTEERSDRQQLRQFCFLLGFFVPFYAQDAQIRSAAHRVLPVALFTFGRVPQYDPHATETIPTLRFTQPRKISLEFFQRASDHFYFFDCQSTYQPILI
jgi:hypothetical protein